MAHFKFGGVSSTGSTTGGETIQEVASAISWSWVFWLGLAVFAGLTWVWMTRANRRTETWVLLAAAMLQLMVPAFMGRAMSFGPVGFGGWWTNALLAIGMFVLWFFGPRWSDNLLGKMAMGGGMILFASSVFLVFSRQSWPLDSMPFWAITALWLNMLFDFEGTDEIKAQPWLVWTLKLSGFAALACM